MTLTRRAKLNYIVDVVMGISFILLFITGLIKFPGLVGSFFGIRFGDLPVGLLSTIHDWSGLIMGIFVLFHIALQWKVLTGMTRKIFSKK